MANKQGVEIKEVPYLVKEYPNPQPTSSKKEDIYDSSDFAHIDEKVMSTPDDKLNDFQTLVDHLTTRLPSDLHKVRAIFSWIGTQNIVDAKYPNVTDPYTPNAFLKAIQDNKSVYPKLFAVMCREANIPCVILQGRARAGQYQVGDTNEYMSSWNAVYVEGGWRLVHCHWAFVSIVGREHGGWVRIETDGKNVKEEIKACDGNVQHDASKEDFWFLTDPEAFIYYCRPEKDSWQLLRAPVSLERFFALPFIRPAFTKTGFSFKIGQTGTVESSKGMYTLIIKTKGPNVNLTYELLFKTENTVEFPNSDGADRYVAMARTKEENEMMFRVTFPMEGTYKLSIFRKRAMLQWLCDFKIVCKERKSHCNPLPANPEIGWGLGPKAKKGGIYEASHQEGIIQSKDGENLNISFKFKGKQRIVPTLKHATIPDSQLEHLITKSIKNNTVTIKTRLDDGEYALLIDSYRQAKISNVLNYLIEAGPPDTRRELARENATMKMVRVQAKKALAGRNKDELRTVIEKFKKLRMDDKGQLTKLKQTHERLQVIENLKSSMMRERADEIEKAIRRAEASAVAEQVQPEVQRARDALNDLYQRQSTPRSVSAVNRRNVAELRAFRTLTAPTREVFKAVFMLLGERKSNLEDEYILKLLKRTGQNGLMQRLAHFNPEQVSPTDIRRATKLLEKQQEAKLQRFGPSLEKVYQEGLKCISEYAIIKSPSIRNEPTPEVTNGNEEIKNE